MKTTQKMEGWEKEFWGGKELNEVFVGFGSGGDFFGDKL
jgi:hypothetical protein